MGKCCFSQGEGDAISRWGAVNIEQGAIIHPEYFILCQVMLLEQV